MAEFQAFSTFKNPLGLTAKGFKKWNAREGYGFQFKLFDGKRSLGEVTDEGNGAIVIRFEMSKEDQERLCKAFRESYPDIGGHGLEVDVSTYLSMFGENIMAVKQAANFAKKGTLYRLKTDDESQLRLVNTHDAAKAEAFLDQKVGAGKYVFLTL